MLHIIEEYVKYFFKRKPIIISIDGNIGSGKSTFIKMIKKKYSPKDIYFAAEPVTEWTNINGNNLLDNFYKDKERWSYTFQNYAYITRLMELKKAINSGKKYIITERSIFTDKHIFAKMLNEEKYMADMEMEMYNKWFDYFSIDVTCNIYIKTDLQNCLKRIKIRNRTGEDQIPEHYLKSLEEKHNDWLLNNQQNVLVISGNEDFKNDEKIASKLFEKFDKYIKSL